eukprot:COSAG03_NODE_215_length_10494_cov_13.007504_15_plen_39_part_00
MPIAQRSSRYMARQGLVSAEQWRAVVAARGGESALGMH